MGILGRNVFEQFLVGTQHALHTRNNLLCLEDHPPSSPISSTSKGPGLSIDVLHPFGINRYSYLPPNIALWQCVPELSSLDKMGYIQSRYLLKEYMGITHSPLPQNNGNLPLPFFGGNYPIVLPHNFY